MTRTSDLVKGTRPDFLPRPDDPIDPVRRERDLRAVFDQPRPAATRMRSRRLLVPAAVAAVVAAVLVSSVNGPDESPRRVLLAAAAAAKAPDPVTGRYWHARSRTTTVEAMWPGRDHGRYLVSLDTGQQRWSSLTGADDSVDLTGVDIVTRPLSEQDRVVWEKAGRPVGIPDAEPAPGASPAPSLPSSQPPSATVSSGPVTYWIGGLESTIEDLLALPTDGARLRSWLLERYRNGGSGDETDWLMWETMSLLDGSLPTTPGTRAAAYELLADLPGFHVMADTGIPGTVGISRQTRGGWSYTVKDALLDWQVIIDPETGALREWRYALAEPGGEVRELPAGTAILTQTVERIGWVNTAPVIPPGTDIFPVGE
ncbi:hypothetical protein BLA60_21070 [Actinophytocola xinjiangensis]|uniref:CU044_5270 family protein n=1 Tax=Actinophytocola xinjiangensis TaxID=485602 RepID=A0A7Z0WKV0_9PSEU|nr:hypothetical protein [Actinophytocola xinjiangensis]OLF09079.1 hypothetical protein BLA60_21070 [Actinophytocola xinjiangensis]